MKKKLAAFFLLVGISIVSIGAAGGIGKNKNECKFLLKERGAQTGTAEVTIKRHLENKKWQNVLKIKIRDADRTDGKPAENALYTVWVDFRDRDDKKSLPADFPTDASSTKVLGVAPAMATIQGVTAGMGLDKNTIVTNGEGKASFKVKLDYDLLEAHDASDDSKGSPVVANLVSQSDPAIGGVHVPVGS